MSKRARERQEVYDKYNGHCAYCGKEIELKDMQVDHFFSKRLAEDFNKKSKILDIDVFIDVERLANKMPACRRCNHYKRASTIEGFRKLLMTLHKRVRDQYINKVAEDYGIISIKPWDGIFYFERGRDTHGQ